MFMSIYNFCIIFQHQKKIFYQSFIFHAFFLNLTNLNSKMVFIHFISVFSFFMIFEGSLSHKKKIDEIWILSLFEHFKVTGAILPPFQNGRQSLIFGPIWKRTWPLDSLIPENYINIYITGLRHLF